MISPCVACPLHESSKSPCMLGDTPQGTFNGLMIVGQNPGREEDQQGSVFVGPSGQLLNYLLARANINRSQCFVTNACKCLSPKNRPPKVDEMRTCRKWLHKEIARWQPKVILALGATAFESLTNNEKIMDFMGRRFRLNPGVEGCDPVIIPTLRPAALLREWGLWQWVVQDIALAGRLAQSGDPWSAEPYCQMPDAQVLPIEQAAGRLREISSGPFAYDIETTGLNWMSDRIACIGFCGQDQKPLVLSITDSSFWPKLQSMVDWSQLRIVQNHKFDDKFLKRVGLRMGDRVFDTMVASHLIDENTPHNLKNLMFRYLNAPDYEADFKATLITKGDFTSGDPAALHRYCGYDTWGCYRMYEILSKKLQGEQLEWLFYHISMPLSRVLMGVEKAGVIWDRERRDVVFKEYEAAVRAAEETMKQATGDTELKAGSTKDMRRVLFEQMALDPVKFTPGDKPSTDAMSLQKLLLSLEDDDERHDFIKTLLDHRERAKAISNWLSTGKGFDLHVHGDGRIRPTYTLTKTRTGRLSAVSPGLHSVPRESAIRGIVKAAPNKTFVQLDMSQAELRVVAIAAEEKGLLEQFAKGVDAHTATASLMFGVPPEQITKEQRAKGKTSNFSIVYLISPQGFADKNSLSLNEAKDFLDQVRKSLPNIQKFSDFLWYETQARGYVSNAFGRKRRLTGLELYSQLDKNANGYRIGEIRRQAVNHFTQSTASDIASLATIRCDARLKKDFPEAQIVISHHDAIIVECLIADAEKVRAVLTEEFERPVPQLKNAVIPVEVHISFRWGEKA